MQTLDSPLGWAFYQHQQGDWSWQIVGHGAAHSQGHFVGIVEAFADAVRNGFRPGISKIASVGFCRRSKPR